MKSKFFVTSVLVLLLLLVMSPSVFGAEGDTTTSITTTEAITTEPEEPEWEYTPTDDYGLFNGLGNWLEEQVFLWNSEYSVTVNNFIDEFDSEFSGDNSILKQFDSALPGILKYCFIFALLFFLIRKIIGR